MQHLLLGLRVPANHLAQKASSHPQRTPTLLHTCATQYILGWQFQAHVSSCAQQRSKKRNCQARQPDVVQSTNRRGRSNLVSRQRPVSFQEWLILWPIGTYLVLLKLQGLPTNCATLQCCTHLRCWDYRPEWGTCWLTHRQHLKGAGIATTFSVGSFKDSARRICTYSF